MNNLILNENVTMSSREIATLTGKRHDNVMRSIRELNSLGLLTPQSEESTFEHVGNIYPCFNLCKRDSLVVVARLSPEFTAAVIDRWQELESGVNRLPNNYIEALEFLVKSEKEKQVLSRELEIAKPAVDFVDNYVKAEGNYNFRQVAKLLNAKEPELKLFLIESGIIYYTGKTMTPYQRHIDAGRFVVKTGVSDTEHAYTQMKFTPKGFNWISELWANRLGEVA